MRNKKIEKTHAKENNHTHKIIFTWFDNLLTSTELQRFHYYQGKITKCGYNIFFLSQETQQQQQNPNSKIAVFYILHTRFGSGRVIKPDQTKLGSTKPNKSPTLRLVQSPTSTAILQEKIPHPCNSSSCPQARRPIEAAHNFNFLIVTPLVNMFTGFLDPQIFSSITNLSSTR